MKKFKGMKARIVTADGLMTDDHFKMAGNMYRITSVHTNDYGEMVLHFYPIDKKKRRDKIATLIIRQKAPFIIYNQ